MGLIIGSSVLKYWILYSISNISMSIVARNVSPHATAVQCQIRWSKTLDPTLRRGNWTEEEEERLHKAVAAYGSSWVQVASVISGRTNDQCREKWHEQINSSTEKSTWTEAEDKILLENVKLIGNRWKSIGLKIGNNRSGAAVSPRVCYQVIFQDSPSVSIALRQVDEIAKFSK